MSLEAMFFFSKHSYSVYLMAITTITHYSDEHQAAKELCTENVDVGRLIDSGHTFKKCCMIFLLETAVCFMARLLITATHLKFVCV